MGKRKMGRSKGRERTATSTMAIPTGAEIRKAREDRGLSVLELSKKAKVARQSIIDWESGKRTPRFPTVRKVMECLAKVQLLPDLGIKPEPKE